MRSLLTIVFLVISSSFAKAQSLELRFKSFAKLSGESQIRVSQIVDEIGISPGVMNQLSKIVIADAPRLGEQRVFTAQMLSEVLRKQLGPRDYTFRIPNQITVVNRGFELSEDLIKMDLASKWQTECKECRIQISSLKLPILSMALKNRPWRIEAKTTLPRGTFSEPIVVSAADGTEQTFFVNGQVAVERKVPVANRTLNANFRLTPEDFRLEWRDVTFATDGTLGESELVGQQVRLVIPAGQIIWAGSMNRERAVKRGDLVRVVTGSDDWQVVLQAVTEQDAYIGDRVNVRNLQTKKIITGEVVAPGEVVIR